MKIRLWSCVLFALVLLAPLMPVNAAPLTEKQWEKCLDKAEASVDQNEVGMAGVEAAVKDQCGDPPVKETGTDKGVGVHPYDLVRSKAWKKKFMALTKDQYQTFIDRLVVGSETTQEGGWVIGEGIAPHLGGSDEAAFAINAATGEVYGAMLEDDKLTGFGFGTDWAKAPDFLQEWAKSRKP